MTPDRRGVGRVAPRTEAGRRLLAEATADGCKPPCLTFVQAKWVPEMLADLIFAIEEEAVRGGPGSRRLMTPAKANRYRWRRFYGVPRKWWRLRMGWTWSIRRHLFLPRLAVSP